MSSFIMIRKYKDNSQLLIITKRLLNNFKTLADINRCHQVERTDYLSLEQRKWE